MKKRNSGTCSVLEVTVSSLEGIALQNPKDILYAREGFSPQVTASVAFSGSVSYMEVGSSSVCSRTGQLQVESEPLHVDKSAQFCEDQCWLRADWDDPSLNLPVGSRSRPHLRVQLPKRAPDWPDLHQTNRDSIIIKERSALEQCDTLSTATDVTSSTSRSAHKSTSNSPQPPAPPRGPSVVWSNAGAVLPEIVELFVRLKSPLLEFVEETGVAYLVVFGNEQDRGKFIMDLPIKRPPQNVHNKSVHSSKEEPSLILSSNARLRVTVRVHTTSSSALNNSVSTATTVSSRTISPDQEQQSYNFTHSKVREKFGTVIQKIQENEKEALALREAQKRAMDVQVPLKVNNEQAGGLVSSSAPFCTLGFPTLHQLMQTITCSIWTCADAHIIRQTASHSSLDSTIATRESMNL